MARHRDIRNMDYSEDYDGYDDVYGHSVDDDYYISPSNRQFIYNREHSQRSSEGDIKEEDESEAELSDLDRTKLASCIDQIKQTLGSVCISRNDLVNIIVQHRFDLEKSINAILECTVNKSTGPDYNKQNINQSVSQFNQNGPQNNENKQFTVPNIFNKTGEKPTFTIPNLHNSSKPKFIIPNLQNTDKPKFTIPNLHCGDIQKSKFIIPKIPNQTSEMPKFTIPKLFTTDKSSNYENIKISSPENTKQFDNISDLVSNHLIDNSIPLTDEMENLHLTKPIISELTPKLANLNISESKSFSAVPDNQSKFQIDLSVALKNISSAPLVHVITKEKETFEIPFIDCEKEIIAKKEDMSKPLLCSFNVNNVKNLRLKSEKKKSMFGRVICKKFRRCIVQILQDKCNLTGIKRFDFSTASPDSQIIGYLRR